MFTNTLQDYITISFYRGTKETLDKKDFIYPKYYLICEYEKDLDKTDMDEFFNTRAKYKIGDGIHRYKDLPYGEGTIPIAIVQLSTEGLNKLKKHKLPLIDMSHNSPKDNKILHQFYEGRGVWGTKVFENDYAVDLLGMIYKDIDPDVGIFGNIADEIESYEANGYLENPDIVIDIQEDLEKEAELLVLVALVDMATNGYDEELYGLDSLKEMKDKLVPDMSAICLEEYIPVACDILELLDAAGAHAWSGKYSDERCELYNEIYDRLTKKSTIN